MNTLYEVPPTLYNNKVNNVFNKVFDKDAGNTFYKTTSHILKDNAWLNTIQVLLDLFYQ